MAKRRTQKRPNYIWIAVVLVVVAAVVLLLTLGGKKKQTQAADPVTAGRNYLASLEKKDPGAVSAVREEIFMRRMADQKETLLQQLLANEVDPFSLFQDYAVLGDSRAVGFWYHDFLDQSRVLADGGNTIRIIPEHLATLQELNPKYIYLCYGLNDTSIGFWDTAEAYAAEYMSCVAMIQEVLPDAKIVVSSILPAQDPAFSRSSRWRWIPDWNVVMEATCAENGVLYAICDYLHDYYSGYWDPDGIHLQPPLYPYWGGQLLVTALYGGLSYED